MAILIQAYDDRHSDPHTVPPNEMLAYLMEANGLTAKDMLPVFGTRGRVSEVLNAKRSISKAQAKRLAARFNVARSKPSNKREKNYTGVESPGDRTPE